MSSLISRFIIFLSALFFVAHYSFAYTAGDTISDETLDQTIEDSSSLRVMLEEMKQQGLKKVLIVTIIQSNTEICHQELHQLMKMQKSFKDASMGILVITRSQTEENEKFAESLLSDQEDTTELPFKIVSDKTLTLLDDFDAVISDISSITDTSSLQEITHKKLRRVSTIVDLETYLVEWSTQHLWNKGRDMNFPLSIIQ